MSDQIVLHDDGTWFVHLGEQFDHEKAAEVTADGRPMRPADDHISYRYVRWYAVEGDQPTEVRVEWKPVTRTKCYRLKSREAAEALDQGHRPDEVKAADYDDDLFWHLYESVTVTEQPAPETVDLSSAVVVEGTPPPTDGLKWVPDLPYALKHRDEYGHLFPGKLVGFRAALAERLKEEFGDATGFGRFDGVQYRRDDGPVKVRLSIPFDPPLYEPKRLKSGRKSTRDKVQRFQSREWAFAPPNVIRGTTRADAAEEWHRQIEGFVAEVRDSRAKPCGHCKGTGAAPVDNDVA
jgi:hypothetical protein